MACRKSISLADTHTFMCTKCQNYFCEECAIYHNNLAQKQQHTCPGHFKEFSEAHSPILVKITKNMTGPDMKGVSIKELESKLKEKDPPSLKIIEKPKLPDTPTVKIIDDSEDEKSKITSSNKDQNNKRKKPVILDDES